MFGLSKFFVVVLILCGLLIYATQNIFVGIIFLVGYIIIKIIWNILTK